MRIAHCLHQLLAKFDRIADAGFGDGDDAMRDDFLFSFRQGGAGNVIDLAHRLQRFGLERH